MGEGMPDVDSMTRHWVSVHQRVRKNTQRSIVILALLAGFAFLEGVGNVSRSNEGYQLAREFTLQLQEAGPRTEVAEMYVSACLAGPGAGDALAEPCNEVRLEEIPEVGWEYTRYLETRLPSGVVRFEGFELDEFSFFQLVLLLPPVLLAYVCLNALTTGRIVAMLRGKAVDGGEVQRCLNSVFSERVTWRLGERRWLYATVWVLAMLTLAVLPSFLVVIGQGIDINSNVVITQGGRVEPLQVVGLDRMTTTAGPSSLLGSMFVVNLVNLALAVVLWCLIVRQLRPADPVKAAAG